MHSWASADSFPQGRAKFSRGGGKTYYLPKNTPKKMLFSSKKVEKHTIVAGQEGGGQGPPLALPCGRPCMHSI